MTSPGSKICDQVHLFADGELDAAGAETFRVHLAGCADCLAELNEVLQLGGLGAAIAGSSVAPGPRLLQDAGAEVVSLAWYRRRSLRVVSVVVPLLAAAAALYLFMRPVTLKDDSGTIAAAFPEVATRTYEVRIAYNAADRWHPHDVQRGDHSVASAVPLKALAALEARDDLHGVAAAYLTRGDVAQATAFLERATQDNDVDADRAAIALLHDDPAAALPILERVLRLAPKHPQALWNQALALRALQLNLAAAEAFDKVAALAEPGWSDEAKQHAAFLRAVEEERRSAWKLADAAAAQEAPLTKELAERTPGSTRQRFYAAVRSATTADEVRALLPLAQQLDAQAGGRVLADLVERIAGQDFARRGAAARLYADVRADKRPDTPAVHEQLFAAAQRAGASDLLMGAYAVTGTIGEHLEEYAALAKATGDPWFVALAQEEGAKIDIARGDWIAAEQRLLAAVGPCWQGHVDYRCVELELQLAFVEHRLQRATEADTHARLAWTASRTLREWALEAEALWAMAQGPRLRHEFALTRAYMREMVLHDPANCSAVNSAHTTLAMMAIVELRPAEARAEMLSLCPQPLSKFAMLVYSDLARFDGTAEEAAKVQVRLAELRARASLPPAERVTLDYVEGRLLIGSDPTKARGLLERAILGADALPGNVDAEKVRGLSYGTLIVQSGQLAAYEAALDLFARELRMPVPDGCVLAAMIDDERSLVVARGADGHLRGHFVALRSDGLVESGQLIPDDLRKSLGGCIKVAVLARAPLEGDPSILPPALAWSYRVRPRVWPGTSTGYPERRVVVADVQSPAILGLPALAPWRGAPGTVELRGADATPARVLREAREATELEFHAHGLVNMGISDVSHLVLSQDRDGSYALTAADVRKQQLLAAPLVILAACQAAQSVPYEHQAWSLPAAFIEAGARAVLAATGSIPDAEVDAFFAGVRARLRAGSEPAAALRDERMLWLAKDPKSWVARVMLFE